MKLFIAIHPCGGFLARIVAKKYNINARIIYTAHGFHFYKGAPLKYWLLYPIELYLSKYTNTLITINSEDYELAKNKFYAKNVYKLDGVGVDFKKFHSISNNSSEFKEHSNFDFKSYDIIKEKNQDANKFEYQNEGNIDNHKLANDMGNTNIILANKYIFISVGELNNNKNHIMQIRAMKILKKENIECVLWICGEGTLKRKYTKLIKRWGLDSNVKLLGYRKDINKLLSQANCLLSTSKREGLPVNVIEAMFMGLPIIATNIRGQRDLLTNCQMVKIDDVETLAKKMKNYIKYSKNDCNGSVIDSNESNSKTNKNILLMDKIDMVQNQPNYDIEKYKVETIMKRLEEIYGI